MKIENRQKLLTFVAVAAIALLVGDRMVYAPLAKAWKDRSARIAELRQRVTQGEETLRRERDLRERWQQMRTNTLPGDPSLAEQRVFKAFENWSRASRVNITSIRPQWKQGGDDYRTLECRVDASGNLETVCRFLYEIEKDPLALKLESVELGARDNSGQQLTLGLLVSGLLLKPAPPR